MKLNKKFIYSSILILLMIAITVLPGCTNSEIPASEKADNNKNIENTSVLPEKDEETIIRDRIVNFYEYYPDGKYIITVEKVKDYLDTLFVLDIRPPESFNQGHIPGAVNIPIKQIGGKLDEIPQNKSVLVICSTGQSAAQTAGILNIAGIQANSLSGGFKAWEEAGLPVEK